MDTIAVSGLAAGIVSVVVGVLVLVWPRIIAYAVGLYLIVIGVIAIVAAVR